jgi:serine/threonine protein kinase
LRASRKNCLTFIQEGEIRDQNSNAVTWTLSGSGTRVSTVEDLFYGTELSPETDNSLQSILRLLEHLELRKIPADDVKEIKFLGRGETFQVYECAVNSAVVAVKRLQIHDTRDGSNPEHFPRRLQAVVREIIIMSHAPVAQHPNVVSLQGYGWGTDLLRVSPFIALEFAEYGTLRAFLKSAKQLTPTKLGLMGDVALGVAALHESGIVHGDLKLDNVLVFPDQERPSTVLAKVSDFGHSVLVGSGAPRSLVYIGTEM